MTHDADAFGWGELERSVNVGNNQTKDILIEHKMITMEQIKRQAHVTWMNHDLANDDQVPDTQDVTLLDPENDPTHRDPFYRRVRSRMITKRILGRLKAADYKILKNKESK